MPYRSIARLIPTMQSLALVKENIKQTKKKKQNTEDMLSLGTKNIVGTNLIRVNADIIASM